MNKEDVLAKSRIEKNDEGFIYMLNEGSKYGTLYFVVIIILLIVFTTITSRFADASLLTTVLWFFLTGHYTGHNKTLDKKKKFLVFASWLFTLACFLTYLNLAFFAK